MIYRKKSVDSTNSWAARMRNDAENYSIFTAAEQTAGRGRRGRTWDSQTGGAFFSVLIRPRVRAEQSAVMTLAAGLAVSEAIETVTGCLPRLKWPNDLLIGGKKVCGILTEAHCEAQRLSDLIVGVGINVNQRSFSPEVEQIATSLLLETGREWDAEEIMSLAVARLRDYEQMLECGTFPIERYRERCVTVGRRVTVLHPNGAYPAEALTVNDDGSLQIRTEDGAVTAVVSGEVSIRG